MNMDAIYFVCIAHKVKVDNNRLKLRPLCAMVHNNPTRRHCLTSETEKSIVKWLNRLSLAGFRVLTVVAIYSTTFCDMTPCNLVEVHQYFGGISLNF
jgi:hypothetical protein